MLHVRINFFPFLFFLMFFSFFLFASYVFSPVYNQNIGMYSEQTVLLLVLILVLACVVYCILAANAATLEKIYRLPKSAGLDSVGFESNRRLEGGDELNPDAIKHFLEHADVKHIWEIVWKLEMQPCETIDSIPHDLPYTPGTGFVRPNRHIGQRKLFDSELQFLCKHLDPKDAALVVYAGSSPSNHIFYLHTLYPNVRFILVDPNETLIYVKDREPHYLSDSSENSDLSSSDLQDRKRRVVYAKCSKDDRYVCPSMDKNTQKRVHWYHDGKIYEVARTNAAVQLSRDQLTDFVKFAMSDSARIFVIEDFYTPEISDVIHSVHSNFSNQSDLKGPVFFWSDIRTNSGDAYPKDADLLWNLAQQYIWIHTLDPEVSMLKFRAPFFGETYEELTELLHSEPYKRDMDACTAGKFQIGSRKVQFPKLLLAKDFKSQTFRYISGTVMVQAYAGVKSTESRLVSTRQDRSRIVTYDPTEYDAKFFYYNMLQRPFCLHINANADPEKGYDLCGDCALENSILEAYKAKNPEFQISEALDVLAVMTSRPLLAEGHGTLFKHFSLDWYYQIQRQILKKN